MLTNRVRQVRQRLQMSQADVAKRIGISRQALRYIETGETVPNTFTALRLAQVFSVRVEDLFQTLDEEAVRVAAAADEDVSEGDRVFLSDTGNRLAAHRVHPIATSTRHGHADAVVHEVLGNQQVRIQASPYRTLEPGVVIAGCDPGLQLLSDTAANTTKQQVMWRNADNRRAKHLLTEGLVHAAAVHIPVTLSAAADADSSFERHDGIRKFHFASWQLGWVVKQGNPKGFQEASNFLTGRFRLANRHSGAGTRKLLEQLLADAGVDPAQVPGYDFELGSHLEVALAVENGAADVGIALSSVAGPLRLQFMPIHTERCELWVPSQHLRQDSVQAMVDALVSDPFRWELAAVGDYDVANTGLEL
ncbi:substrate-binding domain-containing protein [Alicyclobacillus sp. SO9]|uniref:substrate-binding domain-containing protein n=1 Tax=Alicyclobacillus sp. SO9 TaxID=2665646 RepID=UPI0018E8DFEE|nr:substrate-binding domain-containing protein [Alicyclobacillus sp. SO9]QQE79920.1 helix-turn-helix domain-containing protein [Alicyclobacillus sp. SO9]